MADFYQEISFEYSFQLFLQQDFIEETKKLFWSPFYNSCQLYQMMQFSGIKILKNLAIVLAYVMMVLLAYRNGNIETVRLMNNKLSTIEDSALRQYYYFIFLRIKGKCHEKSLAFYHKRCGAFKPEQRFASWFSVKMDIFRR